MLPPRDLWRLRNEAPCRPPMINRNIDTKKFLKWPIRLLKSPVKIYRERNKTHTMMVDRTVIL